MATKEQRDKVWNLADKIRGRDSKIYRKDPYGNVMHKSSYGKKSKQGWEVDHIRPTARDGSDATRNLQALNTRVNREKGDSLVKRSRHSKK